MVIVLRLVALLALLVLLVSCMNMIGCCAIDCERFPQQCEANRRAQSTAAITALASWCTPESWLVRAPVDEVVPQLFRMGPEGAVYQARAQRGFPPPCQRSVGLALDEWRPPPSRVPTVYLFNPHPWSASAFSQALSRLYP